MKIKIKRKLLKESEFPTPAKLPPPGNPKKLINTDPVKGGYFGSSEDDGEGDIETGVLVPYTPEGITKTIHLQSNKGISVSRRGASITGFSHGKIGRKPTYSQASNNSGKTLQKE